MGRMKAVFVGTRKGLFTVRETRDGWDVQGPAFGGHAVESIDVDQRGTGTRVFAGCTHEQWGPSVWRSDDVGATWQEPAEGALRFPKDTGAALARVWQLYTSASDDPDVVWAGVEPAALFRSEDGGRSFELLPSLWDHPDRPLWEPGFGGLGLHSIVRHPTDSDRMWVAISAGGVYRTDDGGRSWESKTKGIRPAGQPEGDIPDCLRCVHKIVQHPDRPERLYAQNHGGVYRSDDAADSWIDIGAGLPSDFGFPMVASPADPDTAYVIPLDSDMYRCTPDGRCRVYRTQDAGGSWEALEDGLPQEQAHLTVLRDAFAAVPDGDAWLAFGTRSGEVFVSGPGGEQWVEATRYLPPVLCVRAAEAA
jgi:photosystem II stability/assembly factor-like uncharacterized protein